MSLRLVQFVMGLRVPFKRLLPRFKIRRRGKEERAVMGPRRLNAGRSTAETRWLMHFMPTHWAVHAVVEFEERVQLWRSVPWMSVWDWKRRSAAVSLTAPPSTEADTAEMRSVWRRMEEKKWFMFLSFKA